MVEETGIDPPSPLVTPPRREVRLVSGTVYGMGSQVVNLATSFLIGILVARLLGPPGKGMLAVVMQVPGILLVVLSLGLGGANIYYIARDRIPAGTAAGNSLALSALLGLASAPVVVLFLRGPLAVVEGVPVAAVVFAVLAVPFGLQAAWLVGVSSGIGDLRLPFWFAVISSAATLVVLGALSIVGNVGVAYVMAASTIGTVAGLLSLLTALAPRVFPLRVSSRAAREMASYSVRSHLSGIAGFLHNRQDILLLGWLAGAGAVGYYSIGVSFAELIWYAPSAVGAAILAKAPRSSEASAVDYVSRATRMSILIMIAFAGVAIPLVPFVIRQLYGGVFVASVPAFYWLLPGAFADGAMRAVYSYHMSRENIYWRQSLGATGLNVVLNLALIPVLGFVGAAIASSISYSLLAIFLIARFVQLTQTPIRELLVPGRSDVTILLRTVRRLAAGSS